MSVTRSHQAFLRLSHSARLGVRPLVATQSRSFRFTAWRRQQFLEADPKTFEDATTGPSSKGKIVLVDFYADWCAPCKMLSPILRELSAPGAAARSGSGRAVDLVTIDTDQHVELAQNHRVSSLPTVVAFKDGAAVSRFVGALSSAGVKDFLQKL